MKVEDAPRCPRCAARVAEYFPFAELGAASGRDSADRPATDEGLPAAGASVDCGPSAGPGAACGRCAETPLGLDAGFALGDYRGVWQQLVLRLKHGGQELLAYHVGWLLGMHLRRQNWISQVDCLVPFPAHWLRHWKRGHNVAEFLALGARQALSLPVVRGALKFSRRTQKQGMLTVPQRFANMAGALVCHRPGRVCDKHVLLIDDVMTSAASAAEAARAVRKAGARSVRVAVVARGGGRQ
jgi:predicted amidophosphoribosyltransferase